MKTTHGTLHQSHGTAYNTNTAYCPCWACCSEDVTKNKKKKEKHATCNKNLGQWQMCPSPDMFAEQQTQQLAKLSHRTEQENRCKSCAKGAPKL